MKAKNIKGSIFRDNQPRGTACGRNSLLGSMGRKNQTEGENEMPRIFILLVNSKHKDEKKGAGRVKKKFQVTLSGRMLTLWHLNKKLQEGLARRED